MAKLNDIHKEILKTVSEDTIGDINWFYNEIKNKRKDFKSEEEIKKLYHKLQNEINEKQICSPKIIADKVLNIKDKEKRRRYVLMANKIAITNGFSSDAVHQLLFNASKQFFLRDFDNPIDALMSKKSRKLSRKLDKIREDEGNNKQKDRKIIKKIKRLKRKARREGISLEEYVKKHNINIDISLLSA